jgi:nicotinate-nucleotide pyrophosphorylase (carboxylating)
MPKNLSLPPWIIIDPLLQSWLQEDIGRGDRTTQGIFTDTIETVKASWTAKEIGIIAGLTIADRVFKLLDNKTIFAPMVVDGTKVDKGEIIAHLEGNAAVLLMGERVALNLAMRLSGIATATKRYTEIIADLPAKLVDTRKTTPGLRIFEKYATQVGGGVNHRLGLDDAVMLKDNHIRAAGGIQKAIASLRQTMPYPLTIEVETENLLQVREAIDCGVDIIMLDNMPVETMLEAVTLIRNSNNNIKIEASGNITLETIRRVAETGVDYISTSAPITRSTWLDLSMRF